MLATNAQTRKLNQKISRRLCKFPVDFQEYQTPCCMAALWNRAGHYIFILWLLSSVFYLSSFPRLISAAAHWMSTILRHNDVVLVQI